MLQTNVTIDTVFTKYVLGKDDKNHKNPIPPLIILHLVKTINF